MATESPIRMLETSGKWPSHKKAGKLVPSSANMAAEEMGLLLNGHRFQNSGKDVVPNRSGSAPPSIEGSLVAIENLISQQSFNLSASLTSLNSSIANPGMPPSLISRENRHLVHHIGGFGNNWRLTSLDDSGNGSLHLSKVTLSTHKEESEDDRSPQWHSDDWTSRGRGFWPGQDAAPLEGQHESLVGLTQEDFPRSPSPVYSHSLSLSVEEAVDADSRSLQDQSVSTSNVVTSTLGDTDHLTARVSSSSSLDQTGSRPPTPLLHQGDSNNVGIHFKNEVLVRGIDPDAISVESKMKGLNISSIPTSVSQKNQEEWQHGHQNNLIQQQVHQQQSNMYQVQGARSHVISQGINHTYIGMDQFLHAPPEFSAEVQPVLQPSGFTPLYATTAAYMTPANPFYPTLQPPGSFSPQYGVGGYALNTTVLPFFAGYTPHSAIPLAYDGTAGPNFSGRTYGASAGGGSANGVELQHLNKSYGQLGYALQPTFADPLQMQYFQQPFWNAYTESGQLDPVVSRSDIVGSQLSALDIHKGSNGAGRLQRTGDTGYLNPRRGGIASPNYFGSPTNMGMLMQFPTSPLASPVLPGSPVGGTCHPGTRNGMMFPADSGRSAGIYPGWQGQRGLHSFDDPKAYSFLEELKSGRGRRFELSDIAGYIVEFSADQHGSRFIQQKLENCSIEEKALVFKEVLPHASKLMTDVFGNYVIQKFFEYGRPEQRKELANRLAGQILSLSLQMYGCRVIQKALDVIDVEQKTKLVQELDGHVIKCVRDQNGNHVIQKCIESIPTDKIGFIISAFRGQVATLSTHPYGCRVIQRVLEHCTDEMQSQFIVDEILESVCALAQDQYGNYVTQHVLERGKAHERSQIISKLSGHVVQLSQHKFASNVVEKCLEHAGTAEREVLIQEIVLHNEGTDNLLTMMKDQFANYVVQKILERCTENQREILLSRIKAHAHSLKKYTYGKHIVARFEQLFGEEMENLES